MVSNTVLGQLDWVVAHRGEVEPGRSKIDTLINTFVTLPFLPQK